MEKCSESALQSLMRMPLLLFFYLILFVIPFGFSTLHLSNRHAHLTNASDQEPLLGFMSAITVYGPSQSLRTSWKPNVSFCEWTGVICSPGTQQVVLLNVRSMGLEGTISPLLANLSFLRILDLRNNSFHGRIPYQLGSLFRLKKLLLCRNQLEGSIPPTLGGCRSLQNLSVNLWSLPFPLKEGNISTHHNESVSEILMKGSLLFVAILLGFILQRDCPPRNLALLGKMPVCFGLRRRDSRRGTALIMILLILMMNIAVASRAAVSAGNNNGTTSSAAGEDVDVGDKLPPDCVSVVDCGDCLPCSPRGQYFLCCD